MQSLIRKYNQIIYAIIGTSLIPIIIFICITIADDLFKDDDFNSQKGVISSDVATTLKNQNLKAQFVSYSMPIMIDTSEMLYVLPVEAVTLEDYVKTMRIEERRSTGIFEASLFEEMHEYNEYFSNLFIINESKNTKINVFDRPFTGWDLTSIKNDSECVMIFIGASEDSNRDGFVNNKDKSSLYVYSFKNGKLVENSVDKKKAHTYKYVKGTNQIFIEYEGLKKGTDEQDIESTLIYKYDLLKDSLIQLVDEKMMDMHQDIIQKPANKR